jgi:hypothetical protein
MKVLFATIQTDFPLEADEVDDLSRVHCVTIAHLDALQMKNVYSVDIPEGTDAQAFFAAVEKVDA